VEKYFSVPCGEIFLHISLQGGSLWRNISPYFATRGVAVAKYFSIFRYKGGRCGEIFLHISLQGGLLWQNISPYFATRGVAVWQNISPGVSASWRNIPPAATVY